MYLLFYIFLIICTNSLRTELLNQKSITSYQKGKLFLGSAITQNQNVPIAQSIENYQLTKVIKYSRSVNRYFTTFITVVQMLECALINESPCIAAKIEMI